MPCAHRAVCGVMLSTLTAAKSDFGYRALSQTVDRLAECRGVCARASRAEAARELLTKHDSTLGGPACRPGPCVRGRLPQ